MPRLSQKDRDMLAAIHQRGGKLHIVTARHRERFPAATALQQWAEGMCDQDYMRLVLKRGDANDPTGEQFFDYILTKKAARAVAKAQG